MGDGYRQMVREGEEWGTLGQPDGFWPLHSNTPTVGSLSKHRDNWEL